jgi:uncharacterized protein
MALTPVLPKNRPEHPSLDYEILRAEGIQHLENLATEVWTDFNAHDPGITLLELLSYAITDLGYRTRRLPIADLVTGGTKKAFYEPVEILPSAPVTQLDLRKILIDLPEVKNAWVEGHYNPVLYQEKGKEYGLKPQSFIKNPPNEGEKDTCGYFELQQSTLTGLNETERQKFLNLNGLIKITLDLDDQIDPENESETRPILNRVMKRLQSNRFLGHDYVKPINLVGKLSIALCLHIEVASGKNALEVATEALWNIEQHLSPKPRFYTFKEMLAKGYRIEDIYNGPMLTYGFLDNQELIAANKIRSEFFHSDLIHLIADTSGVVNVPELRLKIHDDSDFKVKTRYQIFNEGAPLTSNEEKDPTKLGRPLKAIIDLCKSCVFVTQNGQRVEIQEKKLIEALALKRLLAECHDEPGGPQQMRGTYRQDLKEYRSLQYDLPANYGVGDYGVSLDVPAPKRGARKQLQAYLGFFDQILSAYLAQLGAVHQYFAVDQTGDGTQATYQNPDLKLIPGMAELMGTEDPSFIVESRATWEDRRNRLLDHLLARFGEAFSTYVATLTTVSKGVKEQAPLENYEDFLTAKVNFLNEIPALGHDRGKAYDYTGGKNKNIWNSANVPGVKKRVHRILGLKGSWAQQSLIAKPSYKLEVVQVMGKQKTKQFQIVLKINEEIIIPDHPYGNILLKSARYNALKTAQNKRDDLHGVIWNKNAYEIAPHPREQDRYTVVFSNEEQVELWGDPLMEKEAENFFEFIQKLIPFEPNTDKEGFHVLEHILLRPNDLDDKVLNIPLGQDPNYTPKDPYSNWVSIIAPNWFGKFKIPSFQKHFEQTVRNELPAEIAARFCWIDKEDMREFEEKFKAWLEAKANCSPNECHITETANTLIAWLNQTPCSCSCQDCCTDDEACQDCRECNQ